MKAKIVKNKFAEKEVYDDRYLGKEFEVDRREKDGCWLKTPGGIGFWKNNEIEILQEGDDHAIPKGQ